jgi:hypothetical protein
MLFPYVIPADWYIGLVVCFFQDEIERLMKESANFYKKLQIVTAERYFPYNIPQYLFLICMQACHDLCKDE